MKIINCFLIALVTLFLASCTKDLPLPQVEVQSRIVVNAAFSTNLPWKVKISKSTSVTTTEQPSALSSAKVVLKDASGNIIEELVHNQNGDFISSNETKPVTGQTYKVEVSANGFLPVDATGNLPEPINYTITQATESTFDGEKQFKVDFEINDDANNDNYYIIESYILIEETGQVIRFQNELSLLDSNTDNAEIGDGTDRFNRIYLQDNNFDGQTYRTQATIYSYIPEDIPSEDYEVIMVVKSAEESLYNYFKSFDRFKLAGEELFVEPVQVFSNVNNGLGIFGGFSQKEISVEF